MKMTSVIYDLSFYLNKKMKSDLFIGFDLSLSHIFNKIKNKIFNLTDHFQASVDFVLFVYLTRN